MISISRLQRVASHALLGGSLVPLLGAQGVVGPTRLGPSFRPAGLNPPQVPAQGVLQVQLVRLPGDFPGTWTAALTVTGLPAALGGQGGQDLLIGRYDARADRFIPSPLAAACNTPNTEFGAMLSEDGLSLVFERDGWVQRSTRPAATVPFTPPQLVQLPANPFYDPAMGKYAGQRMLYYCLGGTIRRALFDEATGQVIGPSLVVVGPSRVGGEPNSPTPIVDAGGETTGFLHHEMLGAGNDQFLAADLDRDSSSHLVLDTATWLNNGSAAGGLLLTAEANAAGYQVLATPAAWMAGAEATIGQNMRVTMSVPPAAAAGSLSFLMLALFHSPMALPIPGIQGALGLDPGTFITYFPIGPNDPATGEATTLVSVPHDPTLMGAILPVQGATQTGGMLAFTNTSSLRVSERLPARSVALVYDGGQTTLVHQVDPEDPILTATLPASAPLPIELLALDLVGQPMGEPVTLLPGSVASIADSAAASYVARTPAAGGAGTLLRLQDGKGGGICAPHKRGPYCHRPNDWSVQELPKAGVLCIEIQPQMNGRDTECNPVEWEIWSEVGGAPMRDQNGSVDSRTDISEQVCSVPRAGGTSRKLKFRCSGDQRNRCRVTIAVTVVKDCNACPAGKNVRR